ncbi:FxsA family protein [Candidatus Bipolaricaulota bacterium]
MPMLVLLLLFAEIAILIKLGQAIGGGAIFLEILGTVVLGWIFLRLAGRVFVRTHELIAVMTDPVRYLRNSGWSLILAGILLIVPGVLSDIFGLALAARFILTRGSTVDRRPTPSDPDVIDVEYRVHDEDSSE